MKASCFYVIVFTSLNDKFSHKLSELIMLSRDSESIMIVQVFSEHHDSFDDDDVFVRSF